MELNRTFRTAEVIRLTGIPVHKLYYLERKGYINPLKVPNGDIEHREFTLEEVRKVEAIWKYLMQGFKHKIAFRKALEELGLQSMEATPTPSPSSISDSMGALSARRQWD